MPKIWYGRTPWLDEPEFHKPDMERLGFFKELKYVTIDDPYMPEEINERSSCKGNQIIGPGSKNKSATQDGYFNETFLRVFAGESYNNPVSDRRRFLIKEHRKDIDPKSWKPTHGEKMDCGLGSFCATINHGPPAFSPLVRKLKKKKGEVEVPKNFVTMPGKKGTGYGYSTISHFGVYPEHKRDPYDAAQVLMKKDVKKHVKAMKGKTFLHCLYPQPLFDPNPYTMKGVAPKPSKAFKARLKQEMKLKAKGNYYGLYVPPPGPKLIGGNKAGTFTPYPEHPDDVYKEVTNYLQDYENKYGKKYIPNGGPKSTVTRSIVQKNIEKFLNKQNYKTVELITY